MDSLPHAALPTDPPGPPGQENTEAVVNAAGAVGDPERSSLGRRRWVNRETLNMLRPPVYAQLAWENDEDYVIFESRNDPRFRPPTPTLAPEPVDDEAVEPNVDEAQEVEGAGAANGEQVIEDNEYTGDQDERDQGSTVDAEYYAENEEYDDDRDEYVRHYMMRGGLRVRGAYQLR